MAQVERLAGQVARGTHGGVHVGSVPFERAVFLWLEVGTIGVAGDGAAELDALAWLGDRGAKRLGAEWTADDIDQRHGVPGGRLSRGGVLLISWGPFTTVSGTPVAAGNLSATLGAGGALSVSLVPNVGATPASMYYVVVYQLDDNSVRTEYWMVPATTSATLAAVRATPGSGTTAQLASRQYVDAEIAGKASDGSVVHLSGAETIAGTKQFTVPPGVPTPATSGDAANKAYVDNAVAAVGAGAFVSKAGDTMTGPLNLVSDPTANNNASTKHYVDISNAGKASLVGGVVPTSQLGSGSANNTLCLKGDSSWGACGTSTNAVSIQNVPVATTAPTDGQVVTFDAVSGQYQPKTGASANATSLQGTPVDTTPPSDGQAVTFNGTTGKYQPKTVAGALTAGMQAVKYATDFAWTQSSATDLSTPGAKTVSLSSCPPGVIGSEPQYFVYVTGSGTADAASANGLNIALDAQLVADIKGLIQAIEQYSKSVGMTKPAAAAK